MPQSCAKAVAMACLVSLPLLNFPLTFLEQNSTRLLLIFRAAASLPYPGFCTHPHVLAQLKLVEDVCLAPPFEFGAFLKLQTDVHQCKGWTPVGSISLPVLLSDVLAWAETVWSWLSSGWSTLATGRYFRIGAKRKRTIIRMIATKLVRGRSRKPRRPVGDLEGIWRSLLFVPHWNSSCIRPPPLIWA